MADKLAKLRWYWHRFAAMGPREIGLRVQKKAYQLADTKYSNAFNGKLDPNAFPKLPDRSLAPSELVQGVRQNAAEVLRGEWRAFGHIPLKVDDPPKWHFDYFAGRDFQSNRLAFKIDHRTQSGGGDIKVIWEPSRWYELLRLALAAWLLQDPRAQEKCIEWLYDWTRNNPPFTGLNWTSGLETGIRLVQFTWIDCFLAAAGVPHKTLAELRRQILPPHIWYTWRYRSFGSSANNHLLGEQVGLILALARWPELSAISAPLERVAAEWEREVLLQFAEDGGNKEQALGYHLFSLEFCLQCERALEATGLKVSPAVKERIRKAGEFYSATKPENDVWDFGDSDNAWVTPLFGDEASASREWWRWFNDPASSPSLAYWWGRTSPTKSARSGWLVFENSGLAIHKSNDWFIRFDFSPLGYLSIAPHGHLDALHVSIWHRGLPVILDPGTGAYYADKTVRNYLADWRAHNSPHPKAPPDIFPKREGIFLWSEHHSIPSFKLESDRCISAEIVLPYGTARRQIVVDDAAIKITDSFTPRAGNPVITTRWKFAPEVRLAQNGPGKFSITGAAQPIKFEFSPAWKMCRSYNPPEEQRGKIAYSMSALGSVPLESIVSPAFRALAVAPYLTLESNEPGPFEVTISAG